MQIRLEEDEIHEAVDSYVRTQINLADNQEVSIDFTAGRGANGLTATIDVRNKAAKKPAPVMRATESKPEPKAQPVEEVAPVNEWPDQTAEEAIEEEKVKEPKKEAPKGKLFQTKKATEEVTEDDDAPDAVEDKLEPAESIFGKKTA